MGLFSVFAVFLPIHLRFVVVGLFMVILAVEI